ncbi:apolipoprotein N-acyltransferase [Peteryoungia aggregata LMG 23059]|uniref:Apolipoprotein N-acyltransferase n=1 Tax=Peteryoungia aggregata LMG 23059 TaxID=1368425 RepID=A0ABU0G400_9HYPH|nr:apolipoprotein N-acyltransferase [Peteryoungia aggregata]MDQ0420059.1 apolipoprotein N-acyltransferase [Peteryoungia aggregata LMG 23059]
MQALAARILLLWGVRRAGLAVLAGAIGALALPPFGIFAAMFVSFTLLVWLLDGATGNAETGRAGLSSSFWIGWWFGFGYFVCGLWWLGNALLLEAEEFAWALPLAVLGLPAVLALFYGFATALSRLLWSDGMGRVAALAAGFGFAEWLRSIVATGFPWNAIGYAAMPIPLMMQSSHVLGILAISALAVFVFASPALLGTRKGALPGLLLSGLLLSAHFGYGAWRLYLDPPPEGGKTVTFRLVQPSIDQSQKLENTDRIGIFEKHLALTAAPTEEGRPRPDVIVWPETSVPFILTENPDALVRIGDVLQDGQILLTGAVRAEERGAGQPPLYYNSVYMIDDKGQILGASDKVHLTPFGEYVPFETLLRRFGIEELISLPGGFTAAASRTALKLPSGIGFYPLICYEAIFPAEIPTDLGGANLLLNVTNDAWFGATPGPYQHFLQARLRAVETGVPLIRAANNGISAAINPFGQIIDGLSLNTVGALDATVGVETVPIWNGFNRDLNFWLVLGTLTFLAAVSSLGFIRRKN